MRHRRRACRATRQLVEKHTCHRCSLINRQFHKEGKSSLLQSFHQPLHYTERSRKEWRQSHYPCRDLLNAVQSSPEQLIHYRYSHFFYIFSRTFLIFFRLDTNLGENPRRQIQMMYFDVKFNDRCNRGVAWGRGNGQGEQS